MANDQTIHRSAHRRGLLASRQERNFCLRRTIHCTRGLLEVAMRRVAPGHSNGESVVIPRMPWSSRHLRWLGTHPWHEWSADQATIPFFLRSKSNYKFKTAFLTISATASFYPRSYTPRFCPATLQYQLAFQSALFHPMSAMRILSSSPTHSTAHHWSRSYRLCTSVSQPMRCLEPAGEASPA